jgi:predicted ABC-class ATPase
MALMVGGEHHGKPTLLMRALESGVYNHIPGGKKVGCIKSIRFKNQGG